MTALIDQQTIIRRAAPFDVDAIARIWHAGWRDAHLGRVPASLVANRQVSSLSQRVQASVHTTQVATVGSRLAGFVVKNLDEIEQLYVDREFRGSGVAAALLAHGEAEIASRHTRAWLAVVDGNARARRFYERNGWRDAGAFDYPAWTTGGTTIAVPCRRYEKALTPREQLAVPVNRWGPA